MTLGLKVESRLEADFISRGFNWLGAAGVLGVTECAWVQPRCWVHPWGGVLAEIGLVLGVSEVFLSYF